MHSVFSLDTFENERDYACVVTNIVIVDAWFLSKFRNIVTSLASARTAEPELFSIFLFSEHLSEIFKLSAHLMEYTNRCLN